MAPTSTLICASWKPAVLDSGCPRTGRASAIEGADRCLLEGQKVGGVGWEPRRWISQHVS